MQWREGLAFAAVHLAVAIPIILSLEAEDKLWLYQSSHQASTAAQQHILRVSQTNPPADSAPDFNMCGLTDQYSTRENILIIANIPAALPTAWRMPCAPPWSISGMLIGTTWQHPTPASLIKQRTVDGIFLLFIALQWLLIGGHPLRRGYGLRRDPAAFITACTIFAALLSLMPGTGSFATFPSLVAFFAWIWWLSLLLRTLFHAARLWRSARPRI